MRMRRSGVLARPGWLFLGVGVLIFVCLLIPTFIVAVVNSQRDAWPRTTAVVVDVSTHTSRDKDGRTSVTYAPVYEYTVDGRSYRSITNFSSSSRPVLGVSVEIGYDPTNPQVIHRPGELVWVPWMLGGMGTFFLLIFGGIGLGMIRSEFPARTVPSQRILIAPDTEPERPGRASFPQYRPDADDGGVTDGDNDPDEVSRRDLR